MSKSLRFVESYYKNLAGWGERQGPNWDQRQFTTLAWIGAELSISRERGLKNKAEFMQWMSPKSYRESEQRDPQVIRHTWRDEILGTFHSKKSNVNISFYAISTTQTGYPDYQTFQLAGQHSTVPQWSLAPSSNCATHIRQRFCPYYANLSQLSVSFYALSRLYSKLYQFQWQ